MSKSRRRRHGDFHKFLLLALLNEGPLRSDQLEQLTAHLIAQFELVGIEFGTHIISSIFTKFGRPATVRPSRPRQHNEPEVDIQSECQKLLAQNLVQLDDNDHYVLTQAGEKQAKQFETNLKTSVTLLDRQILSPIAAARNTFIINLFLAALKLLGGYLSGSVGLVADGADAAVDTSSALLVWIGMKLQRDALGALIILLMMFITGISIGYDSLISLYDAIQGTTSLIVQPYLVIITEVIALIFAILLFTYQRFVGKRNGSLVLISQSVDSKNHIYVALTVILGVFASMFGISILDVLIGGFIAIRILIDAIALSRETLSSMKGEDINLDKYEIPLAKQWNTSKLETFKAWLLFAIKEKGITTQEALISELEHTFKPKYIPILSEFKFSLGAGIDFQESFDSLINPLITDELVTHKTGHYSLTDKGYKQLSELTRRVRFQYPITVK